MEKMRLSILLSLLSFINVLFAQNLVPNSDFETFSSCPIGPGEITNVTGWSNPDTATADYFNQCNSGTFPFPSLSVPSNIMGYQQARSGDGYAGIICNENSFGIDTDYREYIQIQLSSPLVAGEEYSVEFYFNLSNTSTHYVEEMGVYFSNTFTFLQQSTALNFVPQVAISGTPLNDTLNWTLFSQSFVASGGEEYLIIGNFNNPSNTTSGSTGVPSNIFQTGGDFGYYYIEDVSVVKSSCFEIEKVLVDACGTPEGQNEMVTFRVGNQDLNVADLTVDWPSNSFGGIIQNSQTAQQTATANSTIIGCGHLLEPVGGVLPAGKEVLLITSYSFDPTAHSFANLNDTLIVIYQNSTSTGGHFANYNGSGGTRTLTMSFSNPIGCSDVVSYERDQLVNQNGVTGGSSALKDGAFVSFSPSGNATYDNLGCQVPGGILAIEITSDISSVCGGEVINLTADVEGSFQSVVWECSEGVFSSQGNHTTSLTVNNNIANSFYIYGGVESTCNDTIYDSVLISISGVPNVAIVATNDTLCTGDNVTLTANGANSYSWNGGVSTVNPLTITTGGTYTVIGSSNCGSDTASIFIKELFLGSDTQEDAVLCDTNAIHVENLTPCEDCSYLWNDGTTGPNIVTGEHNYSVNISNGCGAWTINYGYDDHAVYASFNLSADSICVGDEVEFTNTSSSGVNSNYWDYQNGVTSSSDSLLINHFYDETGNYDVTLIVENNFCKDTTIKTLTVSNCNLQTETIIPNIFTPNGDGQNDEFSIQTVNGKDLSATIYNRWGRKVKSLEGLDAAWDGGKNNAGTYYYIIEVVFLDDSIEEYKGIIQLIK